ncbi:MAG: WxL domain-containing protein [Clostridia bacterium]|nr:WxL domain-containing protein [Clostridia bacterium]
MKILFRGTLICLVLVISILLFSTLTYGSDLTVNGGNLVLNSDTSSATLSGLTSGTVGTASSDTSNMGFGTITIYMASAITPLSSTDNIRIDDNRGTSVGWNIVVSATDLTATLADQTSTEPGAQVTITFPMDEVLTVTPNDLTAINSSDLTNVAKQSVGSAVTGGAGVKIASASNGYGAGAYLQQLDYSLTITNYLPNTVTVTPTDAAGSKFANRDPGSKMPLLAGTYSSTVTYALSTGP